MISMTPGQARKTETLSLQTLRQIFLCMTRWMGTKSNMGQMTLLASVLLALYLSYEIALPIGD